MTKAYIQTDHQIGSLGTVVARGAWLWQGHTALWLDPQGRHKEGCLPNLGQCYNLHYLSHTLVFKLHFNTFNCFSAHFQYKFIVLFMVVCLQKFCCFVCLMQKLCPCMQIFFNGFGSNIVFLCHGLIPQHNNVKILAPFFCFVYLKQNLGLYCSQCHIYSWNVVHRPPLPRNGFRRKETVTFFFN